MASTCSSPGWRRHVAVERRLRRRAIWRRSSRDLGSTSFRQWLLRLAAFSVAGWVLVTLLAHPGKSALAIQRVDFGVVAQR